MYKLIEMEEETGNHDKAEKIAEITDQMISLFGLWNYGNTVPYLPIEYSNAIVHAFQRFRAPFSGKIVHIFPEQSAAFN